MNHKEKIKKPKFIILSSPSGGGKSSLCNMLLSARDNFVYSISYTTRPPRGSEIDGVHYHFIDEEEFKNHKNNGKFFLKVSIHEADRRQRTITNFNPFPIFCSSCH